MKRIPIIPTVIVLLAVAVMVRLGFWQLDRLAQKEAMIARYSSAQSTSEIFPFDKLPQDDSADYKRIFVWCAKVKSITPMSGRNASDQAGWINVARCTIGGARPDTPKDLHLSDYVLQDADVVMGWSRNQQTVSWQGGEVAGTVAPGGALGRHIVAAPALAGLQANATPDPRNLPNNHLAYAAQWFLFALTALVIYGLALRKRLAAAAQRG